MRQLSAIGYLVWAFATACYADADSDAVKNADDFLASLKIFELPEGKEAVAKTSWSANLDALPVLLEQEKLFDGMFPTDAHGVNGYKRLIQAKVQSEGNTQLTEKYLLVSYSDQQTGKWKVWSIRKIGGIDVEYEINAARAHLGDTRYAPDQVNYRHYAYWLGLGGKILAAKQALETALAMDKLGPAQGFSQERCQSELAAIQSICGGADVSALPNAQVRSDQQPKTSTTNPQFVTLT
jgi:hypothetical protein